MPRAATRCGRNSRRLRTSGSDSRRFTRSKPCRAAGWAEMRNAGWKATWDFLCSLVRPSREIQPAEPGNGRCTWIGYAISSRGSFFVRRLFRFSFKRTLKTPLGWAFERCWKGCSIIIRICRLKTLRRKTCWSLYMMTRSAFMIRIGSITCCSLEESLKNKSNFPKEEESKTNLNKKTKPHLNYLKSISKAHRSSWISSRRR
mmetsp:Transcript_9447/g.14948  ORF Transcript_9447/g.14948 Transcript_9447/m.14948 type:complete len:202 (-) Transcript_9447:63-668(-)